MAFYTPPKLQGVRFVHVAYKLKACWTHLEKEILHYCHNQRCRLSWKKAASIIVRKGICYTTKQTTLATVDALCTVVTRQKPRSTCKSKLYYYLYFLSFVKVDATCRGPGGLFKAMPSSFVRHRTLERERALTTC